MVEGRLQTRSWEGQDGLKRYKTEITAETLQLGPRSTQPNNNQGNQQDNEPKAPQPKQENKDSAPDAPDDIPVINEDEDTGINPEDIPF